MEMKTQEYMREVVNTLSPTLNNKKFDREKMKQEYKKRFNLEHLAESEIIPELHKVNNKTSNLSKSQRDALVTYFMMFLNNPEVQTIKDEDVNLGEPLTGEDLSQMVADTVVSQEETVEEL